MMRKLFKLALALSYVLFTAFLLIYVRSYHADDIIFIRKSRIGSAIPPQIHSNAAFNEQNVWKFSPEFAHGRIERYWSNARYELHFSRGKVTFATLEDECLPRSPWDKKPAGLGRAAFGLGMDKSVPLDLASGQSTVSSYLTSVNRTVSRYNVAKGSIGWLILLAAILPAFHTLKKMRQPRVGRCGICNYDLTANISGVCPECGTTIAVR